ncbi:hypothetical protein F5Y09DRAFT_252020 [Xylaria sp. FL1042]|nr:hypothetical protein F5Y09DRAFT_252020 [Xylaria sp. FL1042]
MAPGSDENPNNGPQEPFAYVLIPVLVFGLVVSLITCYRFRRRKRRIARLAEEGGGGGGPAFVRDPETGRMRIDGRANSAAAATGRRRAGRRLGLGVGSREEGLNELGEAPPAYTPNAPKPPSVEHVELMTYSQATAEIGTSRSPPTYGEEASSGAANGPGIETAVRSTSGSASSSASETARLSEELRRGTPSNPTASGANDTTRLSEEMRRDATGDVATTAGTSENARLSQEMRRDATSGDDAAASGAGDTTASSEELRTNTTKNATTSDDSDTTRLSKELRRDTTGNTTTTTTEAPMDANTTVADTAATTNTIPTTSSANEPAPPPKAVLPPASN